MNKVQNLLGSVLQMMWNENEKNKAKNKKTSKRSYVAYVYGQIYAEYLKSNRDEFVLIQNDNVREWKRIVNWLKENNHIEDYAYSNDPATANCLVIKNFNEKNMIYKQYTDAIRKNVA